jgi:hypothetical protein
MGSYVNPTDLSTNAGVIFRIYFEPDGEAAMPFGLNFNAMHQVITSASMTDPNQLLGAAVVCDINDNVQITKASLV